MRASPPIRIPKMHHKATGPVAVTGRGFAVWVIMAVSAFLNGLLREGWLIPLLGENVARPASAMLLLVIVYLLAYLHQRWSGPITAPQALAVGVLWLTLTVALESVLGLSQGMSGAQILAAYSPTAPTYWIYVLAGIVLAPTLVRALWRRSATAG